MLGMNKGKSKTTFANKGQQSSELQKRIAEKAYELYLKRGGNPNNELADWFEAERLVKGK